MTMTTMMMPTVKETTMPKKETGRRLMLTLTVLTPMTLTKMLTTPTTKLMWTKSSVITTVKVLKKTKKMKRLGKEMIPSLV